MAKYWTRILVSAALGFALAADASVTSSPARVFLRLNNYYVLYTRPLSPFLHPTGHVVVPLRVVGALLGAEVLVARGATEAVVTRRGHALRLAARSREAVLDGRAFALPLAAERLPDGSDVLVPLSPLANAFNLSTRFDPARDIVEVTGLGVAENDLTDMLEEGIQKYPSVDTRNVVPVSVRMGVASQSGSQRILVEFTLQSVESSLRPKKPIVFYVAEYLAGVGTMSEVFPSAEIGYHFDDPCRQRKTLFLCRLYFDPRVNFSPLGYVLIRIMRQR